MTERKPVVHRQRLGIAENSLVDYSGWIEHKKRIHREVMQPGVPRNEQCLKTLIAHCSDVVMAAAPRCRHSAYGDLLEPENVDHIPVAPRHVDRSRQAKQFSVGPESQRLNDGDGTITAMKEN